MTCCAARQPEFLASDGTGKVFINLEDKDMVAVVDLKAHNSWRAEPRLLGGEPVGMALDVKSHRLVIGCRGPQKMVMNGDVRQQMRRASAWRARGCDVG